MKFFLLFVSSIYSMFLLPQSYAEDNVGFSLAPPPVTKLNFKQSGKQASLRLSGNRTSLEVADTELTGNGAAFVFRNGNQKAGFAYEGHMNFLGDEDYSSSFVDMGATFSAELYPTRATILSAGYTYQLGWMDLDLPDSQLENPVDSSSSTELTTSGFIFSAQHRFPVGDNGMIGVTPYAIFSVLTVDSKVELFTDFVEGSFEDSTNTNFLTFGLDVDFNRYSLTAMLQNNDDTSMTMISLGINL